MIIPWKEVKFRLIFQLLFLSFLLSNNVYSQNVIGGENEYCVNSPVDTIYGINPTTGTFDAFDDNGRATGVTQISWNPAIAVFDPSEADLHGDHAHIVYDGNEDSWKPTIRDNAPNANLDPLPALFCVTDPPHVLSGGTPTGGFYVMDGVNVITEIDPPLFGAGVYSIAYVGGNGVCKDTTTAQDIVIDSPAIFFSVINDQYCENEADVNFTYSPVGGTFTNIPGLTDHGDGTATFSPAASGGATRIIEYTFINGNGCGNSLTKTVQVYVSPPVSFSGFETEYCINEAPVFLTGSQTPLGTFSGPGINDLGNGTATFDPSALSVGGSPYTVTYSYTNVVTTCTSLLSDQTNILPVPSASISGTSTICTGDPATLDIDFSGAGPFDFTYTDGTSSQTITNVGDPYTLTFYPTDSAVYTIESVTQANGCSASGNGSGTVNVNPLTFIVAHPSDQVACAGDNVTFTVLATGSDLTYQWQFNGVDIPLANSSFLNLNNVDPLDEGDYRCVISSSCSPAMVSANATLNTLPLTVITGEPVDAIECEGGSTSFNVQATGSGLSYTWRKNGIDLTDGGNILGSSTHTLVISNISLADVAVYTCYVNGDCGDQTSSPVTLTVELELDIVTQPVSKSACTGGNTSFSVAVTGSNPAYQWRLNNVDIPGANSPTLNIGPVDMSDAGSYTCVITGSCETEISNLVTLQVNESVSIDLQPLALNTCEGSTADFNIVASGSITSYQWRRGGVNLVNGAGISGANSPNLILSNLDAAQTGAYTCLVSGPCGTLSSNSVGLVVDEAINFTSHPVDQEACDGDDVIFSVVNTGTNLQYRWYKDAIVIPGALGSSLVISGATAADAGSYYCEVSNACHTQSSDIATLTLNDPTLFITQPVNEVVCEGDNANLTVELSGSNLTYAWTLNGAAIDDVGSYSGTKTASLIINNLDISHAGVYVCEVSGSCGNINSAPAVLTVNENIVITTQAVSKSICPGNSTSFSVAVTGTNPAYQWRRNNVDLPGANSPTLNIGPVNVSDAGTYVCVVTGSCGSEISDPATLVVNESVSIDLQPLSLNACEGSTADFNIVASGSITAYQWRLGGTDLVNGADVSGANSPNLVLSNLDPAQAGGYTCVVTGSCGTLSSNTVVLVVDEAITILTHPLNQQACEGDDVIFSTNSTGTNLQHRWYKDGIVIPGALGSSLVISGATAADVGSYYCEVSNACLTQSSNIATFTLNDPTLFITQPMDDVVCEGDNANLTVELSGSNLTYAWTLNGAVIDDVGSYSGTKTSSLIINNVDLSYAGVYLCEITGSCGKLNSAPAVLTVNENISISTQPANHTFCSGSNVQFEVGATGTNLSYQWQFNGADIPLAANNTANNPNLIIPAATVSDEGLYRCRITGDCESIYSNSVSLIRTDPATIITQPVNQQICEGNNISFSVTAAGTGLSFQWKKNGADLVNDARITGVHSSTLNINNLVPGDQAVYSCQVSNSCGFINTTPANLLVDELVSISTQPVVFYAVENGNASFSVAAEGDILSYQWYRVSDGLPVIDDGVYSGATTSILTLTNLNTSHADSYYCVLSGVCNTTTSDPGLLNINLLTLITLHPVDPGEKCAGESVSFEVVAAGTNLSYIWRRNGVDLIDDARISGAGTPSLTIDNLQGADAGTYSCLVTGDEGPENSIPITLTINDLTDVVLHPLDGTQCEGDDAMFVIEAAGSITGYQWQLDGVDLVDDGRISGALTEALSIANLGVSDGGAYHCVVSGVCASDISNPAILVVHANTLITSPPTAVSGCEGTAATFSITASGGGISYQWKRGSTNLVNDGRISGVNTKDLTISDIWMSDVGVYSCVVTGPCGSDNSLPATLSVSPETLITTQPADKDLCEGDDAIFMVQANGSGLSFEWRLNGTPLVEDGIHVIGSDTETLIISNLSSADEGSYQCFVSGSCDNYLSDPANLKVNSLVQILAHPLDDVKCTGQSVTLSVLSGDISNGFHWKKNGVKLSEGGKYTGVNSPNLTISGLSDQDAAVYSCMVYAVCDSLNSGLATLTVLPLTLITIQPLHQQVNEGLPVTFTIEAEGELLTYQWQKDGTNIPGANTKVYTIASAAVSDEGAYSCLVGGTCNTTLSDPANLTVNVQTLITAQPVSQTKCEGDAAVFSVTASGNSLTYEWRKDGVALSDISLNISGSGTPNLIISPVAFSDEGSYTCVISGSGGTTSTVAVSLNILSTTTLVSQPPSVLTKCVGENIFFTVEFTGDNLSYVWEKDGIALVDGGNIFGSGNEVLTVSDLSIADEGVYRCVITGTCGEVITDPSTLTVNELPDMPGSITGDIVLCQGGTTVAYEVPVIDHATSYDWTLPYGATIASGAGSRYVLVNFAPDAVSGNITVRGRNACGVGPESAALAITVHPLPLADAGFDQNICNFSTSLQANNNPNGTWTLLSGFATFDDADLHNTDVTYLGRGDNVLMWTVTENNCISRDTLIITNNLVPLDAGEDQALCASTTTLNASLPVQGTGSWSIASGSGGGSIDQPTNPNSEVRFIQKGHNLFIWTINNNGCISRDTVTIINDLPSNSMAGKDTILLTDTYTLQGNTPAIGTGMWSLVNGSGTITNPALPNSPVTNLGIGENVFRWAISNNACYSEDLVSVLNYSPSIVDAGPDQTLCEDYTKLEGSLPNYGTGQWTVVQGTGSFIDASDFETVVYALGQGDNVFKWTIYEYEILSDEVTITNNSPINANAGIDQRLCDNTTSLAGNEPLLGTGQWYIIGGSAVINDINSYNTSITALSPGTNTFRWTITHGTCSSSDEVFIINDLPTVADAGVDQITCEDSITLFPNTPTVGTGEWSLVSGSATFVANKAYGIANDDNLFKWSITNNGCSSADTVRIISHKPTTAVSLAPMSVCVDSMFLPGNTPQYGSGEWSILSGSALLSDPGDPNTLASNLGQGLNRFRWTITYDECISYSEFDLSYDRIITDAGTDQTLCDDFTFMSASAPGVGVGHWSIVGGSGSANFTNPNMASTEVTNLDRGDNLLRWTVTNNSCVSYDDVVITNNQPSNAYAGADRSVCGEAINLNANNPIVGTGAWSVLSGSATIDSPDRYNSQVTNLSVGHNTLRWTISNAGCTSSDEINITNDMPTNIDAGLDQYICADTATLYSSEPVGGFGRWSISTGSATFLDNTFYNTDVRNLEKGENKLVWTVTIAGCSNSDTVLIVNNLPSIPSAGPDQDLCAAEALMAANMPQVGVGNWSIISGSATFEDALDPYTRITNTGNGVNTLSWTITNGSCKISDEVLIINSLPTIAYAGEDRSVCNSTANLLANPPLTGTGTWKVVSGFGVIENENDYNTQISLLGFGSNTLRWTTENGRCTSVDDVIIKNNLAQVDAGLDEIVYQPSIQLVGNKPQAGVGEWQLNAGAGVIESPNSYETTVTNLGEGANSFYWTIDNDGCLATDDVTITYYVLPEVEFMPSPQSGCPPLLVDFINGSVGGYPFNWDFGDGTVSSETNPMHTYDAPGTYNVRLTGTGPDGILIIKDTVVVVYEQPDAEFEVTPDLIYISDPPNKFDEPIHCFNLTSEYDNVFWEFGDGETSEEVNTTHNYLATGIYDVTLHVSTEYGCFDSETKIEAVRVEKKGSITCPNVFTPNLGGPTGGYVVENDYSNDVFHCFAEGLLEYRLEIYNRLGILMFESDDINIGWDGYFNEELAAEGVYAFRITGVYNSAEKFTHVGSVMIIYNE